MFPLYVNVAGNETYKNLYRLIFLKSNYFTMWIFTFLLTFQTISNKGWVETLFFPFLLLTFPKMTLLLQKFLETVQKVSKMVDIHFFKNVDFEKNLPVTKF